MLARGLVAVIAAGVACALFASCESTTDGAACSLDADCNDGVACNGGERCVGGACERGTPPSCDDGVACTVDVCQEPDGSCRNLPDASLCAAGETCGEKGCAPAGACAKDADCDDGVHCNGTETCAQGKCADGPPPSCEDAEPCTLGICDEATAGCIQVPDHASCGPGKQCDVAKGCVPAPACVTDAGCDDGFFCNGVEKCLASQCAAGMPPKCDDTVSCTVDFCDESGKACKSLPSDKLCGANHTCDAKSGCLPECTTDAQCDDGQKCNGAEKCVGNGCAAGTPLSCLSYETCDPTAGCTAPRYSLDFAPGGFVINTSYPTGDIATPTIEAWIFATKSTGYRAIVQINVAGDDALYINPGGELMLWPCSSSGVPVPLNQWVHTAASYDGNNLRYYLNGTEVSVVGGCSDIQDFDFVRFGGIDSTDGEHFGGRIDEVRVWSVPRDAAAITATMNKTLSGKEPGLVGYWPIDEGAGNLVLDHGPNGYHGTASLAPTWTPDAPF
jgi:hypothetical protein